MTNPKAIGRYQIEKKLGEGGAAIVYLAHDPQFSRQVAVKMLLLATSHSEQGQVLRTRFQREARIIAALEHPAILPVYDFGQDAESGQPYLVMRYLSGGSLADRLRQGPLPIGEVSRIFSRLAGALDNAHQRGVVHRDLKPSNILFDDRGEPYISDFGIAKLVAERSDALTSTGAIIGSPTYMSPEQARGERIIGPGSDVYSLGTILFEALSGQPPYKGDTPLGIVMKHVVDPVPDILAVKPDLPPGCRVLVEKALTKDPADRFQSAGEMAQALQIVAANGDLPTWTKPTPPAIPVIIGPDRPVIGKPETPTITKPPLQHYWPVVVSVVAVAITVGLLLVPFLSGNPSSQPGAVVAAQIRSIGPYAIGGLGVLVLFVIGARAVWPRVQQIAAERRKQTQVSERRTPEEVGSQTQVGEMTVHLMAKLKPEAQEEALALIGREHEMRLTDLIAHHGGGRYLLRGFGRFGGTTLINQIIQSVKAKLGEQVESGRRGLVLAVRVEFTHLTETGEIVPAMVREFKLESAHRKLKPISEKTGSAEQTISLKINPVPGIEASFQHSSGKPSAPDPAATAEKQLLDSVRKFIDRSEPGNRGLLERVVNRALGYADAPVRVVFVIDRIESEAVFTALRKLRLFEDERITFFAIVRQEHYLKWSPETRNVIDGMGFHSYYVRSLWEDETNFVDLLLSKGFVSHQPDERLADFRDHIAYLARGAPGEAVREILNPKYCRFPGGAPVLSLRQAPNWKQVQYHARCQRLLAANWPRIIGEQYLSDEEMDQARLGICEAVDWMDKQGVFGWKQLCDFASGARVPVHPSEPMRNATLETLLEVLIDAEFLQSEKKAKEKQYRVAHRLLTAARRPQA